MSRESMCDVHEVAVYRNAQTTGAQMGVVLTPTNDNRTLRGNMQQLGADEVVKYHVRSMRVSHEFYLTSDPLLTINHLLLYEGKYMAVRGVYHDDDIEGTPSVWVVPCDELKSRGDG